MTSDEELKALGVELGAALFAWYQARGAIGRADATDTKLYEVVGRTFMPYYPGAKTEDPNQPTGDTLRRPWAAIPAGWFVKAPNGTWYEILKTRRDEGVLQHVTMLVNGQESTWPRPIEQVVSCRRGTRHTEVSDAVDLFGEGAEIREDELP